MERCEFAGLSEVREMSRRTCGLSSVELLLSTLLLLLFGVCVGLSVVTWLALDNTGMRLSISHELCWRCSAVMCDVSDAGGEQSGSEFSGILVISNMVFTEELLDKHSAPFKALAYDSEQKVTHTNSRLGEARFRSDTKSTLPIPISIRYLGSFF